MHTVKCKEFYRFILYKTGKWLNICVGVLIYYNFIKKNAIIFKDNDGNFAYIKSTRESAVGASRYE